MKTQNKIILTLTIILLSFILMFGGFIYYTLTQYSYQDFHERLHIRAVTTAKIQLEYHKEGSYLKSFKAEYLEKLANEQDFIVRIDTIKDLNILAKRLEVSKEFLEDVKKQMNLITTATEFFTPALNIKLELTNIW